MSVLCVLLLVRLRCGRADDFLGLPDPDGVVYVGVTVCELGSWDAVKGAVCDWCRPLFTHPTACSNLYNKGLTGSLPLSWGNALEYVIYM